MEPAEYNSLKKSSEIMELQEQKNKELEEIHEKSKLKNITLRIAIDESISALRWILNEFLYSPRKSFEDIMDGREQRLRGVGFLLIFFSGCMLIIDGMFAE